MKLNSNILLEKKVYNKIEFGGTDFCGIINALMEMNGY
jgi:hypothetical protein